MGLRAGPIVVDELFDDRVGQAELLEGHLEPRDDEQDKVMHRALARQWECRVRLGPDEGDDAVRYPRATERVEALVEDVGNRPGLAMVL